MEDEIMTFAEVGDFLKISRAKVYELVNRKENPLPVIRLVGSASPRIVKDHLMAWLNGTFDDANMEIEDRDEDMKGGE